MSNLSLHRQALFCNDDKAIQDYDNAMDQAVQAVKTWLQEDKLYTGGSIKELRSKIAFAPSADGLGLSKA